MTDDPVLALKNKVATSIAGIDSAALENHIQSLDSGMPPFLLAAVIIIGLFSLFGGIFLIAGICLVVALIDFEKKKSLQDRRLQSIADEIARAVCKSQLKDLDNSIRRISLRSLKESKWLCSYAVAFSDFPNASFGYNTGSSSITAQQNNHLKFDANHDAIEVTDSVFVQFKHVHLSLKCDFRIIRTPLESLEVSGLFRTISDAIPALSPRAISIEQYSSTKSYRFTEGNIEPETRRYLTNRTKNVSKKYTKQLPLAPAKSIAAEPSTPAQKQLPKLAIETKGRNLSPITSRLGRKLTLLSAILQKRKATELIAMQVVSEFEIKQGRSVLDVSTQNLGYDIVSMDRNGRKRHIEVKGLSKVGTVILTANELSACANLKSDFYLYVVENCDTSYNRQLLIVENLSATEFTPQVVDFEISREQQNLHTDETYLLSSNEGLK